MPTKNSSATAQDQRRRKGVEMTEGLLDGRSEPRVPRKMLSAMARGVEATAWDSIASARPTEVEVIPR